ncbi:hypothetical protein [Clostridium sp. VAP23]|uniref:hypothetical protein n=1 Tax=Clostridium sp. VAP23 TaxID=2949981 RepID=UPI00207AA919|nr:hypothetical protein [Clostridium sp. VAP23]
MNKNKVVNFYEAKVLGKDALKLNEDEKLKKIIHKDINCAKDFLELYEYSKKEALENNEEIDVIINRNIDKIEKGLKVDLNLEKQFSSILLKQNIVPLKKINNIYFFINIIEYNKALFILENMNK